MEQGAQHLTQHQGQQEQFGNPQNGLSQGNPVTPGGHEQGHQQRGKDNAQEAGQGGVKDGRRHIAPGQTGHGHRGRHGGRQSAQVAKAQGQPRGHPGAHHAPQGEPEQGEEDVGQALHRHVYLPAHHPVPQIGHGQAQTVEEKDQGNAPVRHQIGPQHPTALAQIRVQAGQGHGPQHTHQEPVLVQAAEQTTPQSGTGSGWGGKGFGLGHGQLQQRKNGGRRRGRTLTA